MAAPSISVRLSSGVYNAMVKLAKLEHKTITDVGRELIERGLSSQFDRLQEVVFKPVDSDSVSMHL